MTKPSLEDEVKFWWFRVCVCQVRNSHPKIWNVRGIFISLKICLITFNSIFELHWTISKVSKPTFMIIFDSNLKFFLKALTRMTPLGIFAKIWATLPPGFSTGVRLLMWSSKNYCQTLISLKKLWLNNIISVKYTISSYTHIPVTIIFCYSSCELYQEWTYSTSNIF